MPSSVVTPTSGNVPPSEKDETPWFSFFNALVRPFFKVPTNEQLNTDHSLSDPKDTLERLRAEKAGTPELDEIERRHQRVMDAAQRMAEAAGIAMPEMRLTEGANDESKTTREHTNYIILSKKEFLAAMGSDEAARELIATIGHEMAHLRAKDTYPLHNVTLDRTRMQNTYEIRADLVGYGPLLANNYQAGINSYKDSFLRLDLTLYNLEHPEAPIAADTITPAQMKMVAESVRQETDPNHPSEYDRIAYLERAAALQKEYEAGHAVTSRDDREAESQWITKKVMQEIRDKKVPELTNAGLLPDDIKGKVQGMQQLPMSDVETHGAPQAPAAPKEINAPKK